MPNVAQILASMRANPRNIDYADLFRVCEEFFGAARNTGARTPSSRPHGPATLGSTSRTTTQGQDIPSPTGAPSNREVEGTVMSQTITDTARYSFRVTWSPEDAEFIATCVEFPSLSWLAGTPEEALTGLRIVVDEVVDDMRANNEPVPEPLSTRHYSGKFQLRLGEDLHRRLVIEAAEQHLSLNQYVTRKLAVS
ncbi:hypothetical prophage protein [Cutibacterium acnes JCM 18909]|nr:hypothetical prophage protein [Cutibacterium acnes JCM 18909]